MVLKCPQICGIKTTSKSQAAPAPKLAVVGFPSGARFAIKIEVEPWDTFSISNYEGWVRTSKSHPDHDDDYDGGDGDDKDFGERDIGGEHIGE